MEGAGPYVDLAPSLAYLADTGHRFNDMNQRFTDMQGTLRTFMWISSAWFTFLTAVLAVFGFLRR